MVVVVVGRTSSPGWRVTGSDSPVSDDSSIFIASPCPMSCSRRKASGVWHKVFDRVTGFGAPHMSSIFMASL